MEKLKFNSNNKKYYSEDFIKGFECGVERQFNADMAEKTAEWIKQKSGDKLFPEEIVCSKCYHSNSHLDFDEHYNPIGKVFLKSKYCPNCGAKMEESGET